MVRSAITTVTPGVQAEHCWGSRSGLNLERLRTVVISAVRQPAAETVEAGERLAGKLKDGLNLALRADSLWRLGWRARRGVARTHG